MIQNIGIPSKALNCQSSNNPEKKILSSTIADLHNGNQLRFSPSEILMFW